MANRPHILVLTDGFGPTYQLVAKLPFAALQAQGLCEMRMARPIDSHLVRDLFWCDVLFVVRGFKPSAARVVRIARRMQRFVVLYWDDNLFDVPRFRPEQPTEFEQPRNQRSAAEQLRSADLIAVANPKLIEVIQTRTGTTSPAVALRAPATGVPADAPRIQPPTDVPVIGYGGNFAHSKQLLAFVVPALEQLAQEGRDFRVQIAGPQFAPPPGLADRIEFKPWMDYAAWVAFRDRCGWAFTLAPLPGTEYYSCKYQNKFMEAAAAGIPCIYSNVLPYAAVIEDGVNGLLVDNSVAAWREAIRRLLDDPDLRARIVQESWQLAHREYSLEAVCADYRVQLAPVLAYRSPRVPPTLGLLGLILVSYTRSVLDYLATRAKGKFRGLTRRLAGRRPA